MSSPHFHQQVNSTADGCCHGNQHKGKRLAGLGVFWGDDDERNVSKPYYHQDGEPTNNRAELAAILRAISDAIKQSMKKVRFRN